MLDAQQFTELRACQVQPQLELHLGELPLKGLVPGFVVIEWGLGNTFEQRFEEGWRRELGREEGKEGREGEREVVPTT